MMMWQTSSQRVLSLLLLLLLGVAAASAARSPSSSSRSVSVSMHAPWPTLPLSPALEASEFFAEASQASFWEFAKRIGQRLGAAEGTASTESEESDADVGGVPVDTADGVLAHTLITARGMVPPLYHKVLEVSLDTRAFAPAVEAQRQVAEAALRQVDGRCTEQFEKGDAWAVISWPGVAPDVDGHPAPVCAASDLEAALEHAKPVQDFSLDMSEEVTMRITRHDHVFPSRTSLRSSQSAPTVFVYGLLGTTSFKKFHGALERLVSNGLVTYVYRHAPSPISSDRALPRTYLRGFGVTLDLKSMEYKALDDRALGGDNDDDDDGDGGNGEDADGSEGDPANDGPSAIADDEELFGVYFRKLLDRHPSMEAPLRSFRDTLLAEQKEGVGGDPGDMKVWDMKDLGLQAAQSIRAAKDPLKHLGEISQNFPLYARRLIGVSVEDKLRRQAQAVSRSMEAARPGAGTNSVLLNGQTIDAGSDGFNVFELLTAILGEASSQSRFARLGLAPEVLEKVKEAAENPGPRFGSDLNAMIGMRVDTRSGSKGCIYYMNNLEKDKAYAQWPKQVANLMQQAFQLFAVRKNLYTGVFVLDPTTPVGLGAIRSMLRIKDMNIPLRFGIAMVPSNVHTRSINSVGDSDGDNGVTYDGPSADDPRKATVSDIVRLVASAKKKSGTGAANAFLAELSKVETFPLSRASVIAAFATGLKAQTGTWSGSSHIELAETTLGSDKYGNVPMKIESYVRAKGLAINSYAINGKVHDSVGTLEQDLMQVIFAEQQRMQQLVQRGIVRDKTNAYAYFTGTDKKKKKSLISSAFAFSHYDARILVDDQNAEFVPLVAAGSGGAKAEEVSSPASVHPQTLLLDPERKTEVPYFTSKNFIAEKAPSKIKLGKKKKMSGSFVPVTHWIIADFCTDYGLSLAASAVERLPGSDGAVRIALFHRGETKDSANGACLDADNVKTTLGLDIANRLSSPPGGSHAFVSAALSSVLPPDVRGPCVITNGRLVRLAASNIPFTKASFMLLEKYENVRMITRLHRALRRSSASYKTATARGGGENDQAQGSKIEDQNDFSNEDMPSSTMSPHELIMRVNSLVSQQSKSKRQKPAIKPARAKKRLDAVSFLSEGGRNDMQVVAVVDPLSVAAQRITPTLLMLRDVFNMSVSVILNPATDITEFPLKNFYRFVPTRVRGSQHGDDIVDMIGQKVAPKKGKAAQRAVAPWGSKDASATKFRRLPKQHVLTLKLVTPEAWVAMKYKVEDDLDNIRLDDATMGSRRQVNADFRLTSLLIAGTCTDLTHHKPPNGLQLVLQFMDGSDPSRNTDTLVMQNLGYFQLQAQPGVWTLRLDEGRASELYALAPPDASLSSLDPVEHGEGLPGMAVTVRSFADTQTSMRVRKRQGKESVSLLDKITNKDGSEIESSGNNPDADTGLMGYISNIWSSDDGKAKPRRRASGEGADDELGKEEELDTIHVFSLASGHLYERLLRIMMLSVTKRTSGPVKFWLVENFLSPQFKMTIGEVAKEAGFEVALVTYKWPSWLRRQTEKQRIIWGYKILFLDVLFPLHVPKIITVDADQVVRADLRELWDMDLHGAPYAYTPFCTSRKETLGYQFWRTGYWKDHLGDKPYHISALYVVDLVRFRRMAAGDHLRAVYDQLSRDPNSLSNLDQDLPNYVQNQIPIFSLPTEWLWCASWCSDESKAKAKTIDLCNHPETKEPKLDMAKRIISGELFEESWIELDEEVAVMMETASARTKQRKLQDPAIEVNKVTPEKKTEL